MTTLEPGQRLRATRPAEPSITPRPERFSWPGDLPRYWFAGDPFRTHFMNALSLLFPQGEQFFIDAVQALRHVNQDPKLEAAMRGFIGQESWHRHAHLAYNNYLASLGLPVAALEERLGARIAFVKEHLEPIRWLAATVCLEHFTAIMAQHLLTRPDQLESMSPHFRRLWIWHALEELEHKAVAFDLYVKAGGGTGRRVRVMLLVTLNFGLDILRNLIGLLKADGQLTNLRIWASGAAFLLGPRHGLVVGILPRYLRFFKPGFHPSNTDDAELIRGTALNLQLGLD